MANTASRLITLIMLLQRQPNQTAGQLAQALDVSVRTVQRYMTTLDEMGIPIYAELREIWRICQSSRSIL